MNYLELMSAGKERFRRQYPQYWLDSLVDAYTKDHRRKVTVVGQVLAVLRHEPLGFEVVVPGINIVTDVGDEFYAYRGTNAQPPTTHFTDGAALTFDGIMELYNGASSAPAKGNDRSAMAGLVTGSDKAMDATYPKRDDDDTDNTGAGVDIITYRVSYTTAEANANNIADVIITNPSPGASENLLMHALFAATFNKTSSDTLKVFVNHTMNGV
jgi:hypothetical protein